MKVYVVTKTDIFGTRYDIFPDILYFASTMSEAIDVIAKDSKASIYDIEHDLDKYGCFDILKIRYTVVKYVD